MKNLVVGLRDYGHLLLFAAVLQFITTTHLNRLAKPAPRSESVEKPSAKPAVQPADLASLQPLATRIKNQVQFSRSPYSMSVVDNPYGFEIRFSLAHLFVSGSVILKASEYDRLLHIFETFRLHTQNVHLMIEVHTDPLPVLNIQDKLANNDQLTEIRARALADLLVASGFDRANLETRGMGSRTPLTDISRGLANVTYDELMRNRRAIIYVSKYAH